MSNLSVAEEFTSTKIKYGIQLLNTMQKKPTPSSFGMRQQILI